ncbi:MAG: AraC family transcriptional regulator [Gemmatimonadaceae bacterium]|nr:AraC family transcriptional regulator [Gemmatimonadaceae bacterium]
MHFGPYSLLLLVAAANGFLFAALLRLAPGRHNGSAWLSTLLAVLSLRTMPYALGFAGAYDLHPALTFAPFDFTLAWGPLLWAYTTTLATGSAPPQVWRHFVPVGLQFVYQLACFALPLQTKWEWYTGAHLHVVEPWGAVAVLVSLGAYSTVAWRQYGSWQRWLDENVSNREESRLTWLRTILVCIIGTGLLGVVMMGVHLVRPLDYFARLPIIVALAVLTYLVGLLGFRFGRGAIPMTHNSAATGLDVAVQDAPIAPTASAKDYAAQAEAWRALVVQQAWHRDPQLTLATLASALNTSPRSLSRTLNDGLGVSFNDFVNALRVQDAAERLCQPGAPDVLRVALDVGFASKASFNRAFKRHLGTTPSALKSTERPPQTSQFPPIQSVARTESTE